MRYLRKIIRITATVLILSYIAASLVLGAFSSNSICDVCGAEEHTTQWQFLFTPITYWRTASVHSTLLSTYLDSHGITPPHTHHFLFDRGSGNLIMCGLGKGHSISSAAHSREAPLFLDAINRLDGPAAIAGWKGELLDWHQSSKVMAMVGGLDPSPATTLQQLKDWKESFPDVVPAAAK